MLLLTNDGGLGNSSSHAVCVRFSTGCTEPYLAKNFDEPDVSIGPALRYNCLYAASPMPDRNRVM
jgi:hypothetical protein